MAPARSFLVAAALAASLVAASAMDMGGMGGMSGVQASPNMTDPCYTDPSAASCATFRRAMADWTTDMTSLCTAMPYMVGCHLWEECMPLIAEKNEYGNASAAYGTYCSMPSLVGDICVEMPRMKGCEAWNALCGVNNTVVELCSEPGPIPDVPWTFDVKADVDTLCAGPAPVDACEACATEGRMNFSNNACPDPMYVLERLCQEPENAVTTQCGNFTKLCSLEEVVAVMPNVCAGNSTMYEPPTSTGAGGMGGMTSSPAASPSAAPSMAGMAGMMSSGASSSAGPSALALAAAALAAVVLM